MSIKEIEKTIEQLSSNLDEADTIIALRKQILSMQNNKCKHGEYTDKKFNGCKTCGSAKIVICSNEKVIGKRRNGNLCKPNNCKYFKIV